MSSSSGKLDDPGMMEVTGKILIATIVALLVVIILVFLFHIYARWLWLRRQQHIDSNNINHRRQDHHNSAGVTVLRRGLDASFLKTLPISQFDSKDFKDGCLECSVCLSEVQHGEDTRILPKCHHAFHAECIDMWFHSHSTCPICRTLVSDQQQTEVSVESLLHQNQQQQQEHHSTNNSSNGGDSFPANVLFWGDETEVSTLTSQLEELEAANQHPISLPFEPTSTSTSSTSQTKDDRLKKPDLVIDIPRASRNIGDNNEQDQSTPMMRSLRRILSSSRRFYPFSPSTPNNNNIDQ